MRYKKLIGFAKAKENIQPPSPKKKVRIVLLTSQLICNLH